MFVWATVFIQAILTVMARNHYTMDGDYCSKVFFFHFCSTFIAHKSLCHRRQLFLNFFIFCLLVFLCLLNRHGLQSIYHGRQLFLKSPLYKVFFILKYNLFLNSNTKNIHTLHGNCFWKVLCIEFGAVIISRTLRFFLQKKNAYLTLFFWWQWSSPCTLPPYSGAFIPRGIYIHTDIYLAHTHTHTHNKPHALTLELLYH